MVNMKNNPLKNNTKGIYMHDDTAISYLQRSLQYLIRPGNLLYCGLLAAVFIALRLLGDERLAGRGIPFCLQDARQHPAPALRPGT